MPTEHRKCGLHGEFTALNTTIDKSGGRGKHREAYTSTNPHNSGGYMNKAMRTKSSTWHMPHSVIPYKPPISNIIISNTTWNPNLHYVALASHGARNRRCWWQMIFSLLCAIRWSLSTPSHSYLFDITINPRKDTPAKKMWNYLQEMGPYTGFSSNSMNYSKVLEVGLLRFSARFSATHRLSYGKRTGVWVGSCRGHTAAQYLVQWIVVLRSDRLQVFHAGTTALWWCGLCCVAMMEKRITRSARCRQIHSCSWIIHKDAAPVTFFVQIK